MMHGNGWYGNGDCVFLGNSGYGGWHFLMMIGVTIIIIAAVMVVRRKSNGNGSQALNTLKELYVKGDITEEEYLKRKNVIEK